ncbi:PH domain-containing protein [Actinopolyspora mortivallis]|uniref:PH domain-containing protein n=1 Tax=Actinopolyspora mortivallis TaxID=33906 RepID=UPI000382182A|nr:PH domain-containing protein [Actinopolyspora mortivallis]
MAYPDDLLGEGEHVLLHRHPHWKTLCGPFAALVLLVGAGGWLAVAAAPGSWWFPLPWVLLGLGGVLLLWLVLAPLARWGTTHFVVTSHRLMIREGVLTRSGVHIPVARINSVQSRRSLLDRILGSGTLIVESASDEPLEFEDVPGIDRFQSLLHGAVDDESHGERFGG